MAGVPQLSRISSFAGPGAGASAAGRVDARKPVQPAPARRSWSSAPPSGRSSRPSSTGSIARTRWWRRPACRRRGARAITLLELRGPSALRATYYRYARPAVPPLDSMPGLSRLSREPRRAAFGGHRPRATRLGSPVLEGVAPRTTRSGRADLRTTSRISSPSDPVIRMLSYCEVAEPRPCRPRASGYLYLPVLARIEWRDGPPFAVEVVVTHLRVGCLARSRLVRQDYRSFGPRSALILTARSARCRPTTGLHSAVTPRFIHFSRRWTAASSGSAAGGRSDDPGQPRRRTPPVIASDGPSVERLGRLRTTSTVDPGALTPTGRRWRPSRPGVRDATPRRGPGSPRPA